MKLRQRQNFIYVNCASKIYIDFISRVENLVKFRIAREIKFYLKFLAAKVGEFYVKFKYIRADKFKLSKREKFAEDAWDFAQNSNLRKRAKFRVEFRSA